MMRRRAPVHRSTSFHGGPRHAGGDSPRVFRERHRNARNEDHQCSSLEEHKAHNLAVAGSTPVTKPTLQSVAEQVRRPGPLGRRWMIVLDQPLRPLIPTTFTTPLKACGRGCSPRPHRHGTRPVARKGGVHQLDLRDEPRPNLDPAGSAGARAGQALACVICAKVVVFNGVNITP
jgi:hypothetical protein